MKSKFLILPALCFGLVFSSCDNDRRTAQGEGYEQTEEGYGDGTEYGVETERTSASGEGLEHEDKTDFAQKVSSSNLKQVEMAQLAQQNAQSQEVRDFAEKMANDHRQAHDRLNGIVQDDNIRVSQNLEEEERSELDDLREKTGEEFDSEYLDKTIDAHESQIDELETVRDEAQDEELRSWAEERLMKLREHRDEAERLKESVSEDNGGVLDNIGG